MWLLSIPTMFVSLEWWTLNSKLFLGLEEERVTRTLSTICDLTAVVFTAKWKGAQAHPLLPRAKAISSSTLDHMKAAWTTAATPIVTQAQLTREGPDKCPLWRPLRECRLAKRPNSCPCTTTSTPSNTTNITLNKVGPILTLFKAGKGISSHTVMSSTFHYSD